MRKRISGILCCILTSAMIITGTGVSGLTAYDVYGRTYVEPLQTEEDTDNGPVEENILLPVPEEAQAVEEVLTEEDAEGAEPENDASDLPEGNMFLRYINNGNNRNIVSAGEIVPMGKTGGVTDIFGQLFSFKDGDNMDHKAFYVWAEGENTEMPEFQTVNYGYYHENIIKTEADIIVIEDGITRIGDWAFRGGSAKTVCLPGSVEELGCYVFSQMKLLETVNLQSCTKLEEIPYEAFSETSKLESIDFPPGIKTIEGGAFRASGLKSLVLPPVLEQLGGGTSLYAAFNSCSSLVSTEDAPIVIPKTLKTCYTYGAFTNCPKIKTLRFEEGTAGISQYILYNCDNVTSVRLPSSAVEIGDSAFENSDSLKTVDFNNAKIKKIGQLAFSGCKALDEITLPDTLTDMGTSVFTGCTSLENISIPEGIMTLNHTFEGCTSLKTVQLPDTLVKIDNSCFRDCIKLKTVNWPHSLSYIGEYAFRQVPFEGDVALPDNLAEIGNYAFSTGVSLNKVILPGSICNIGIDPFYGRNAVYEYKGNAEEWAKVSIIKPSTYSPYTDNADSEITKKLTYTMTDHVDPSGISLKENTFKAGELFELKAVVSPADASQNVTWNGYNSSVAKPSHIYTWRSRTNYTTGEFRALKAGKFNVTCAAKDGTISKTFEITVTEGGDDPKPPVPPTPPAPTPSPSTEVKLYAVSVQDGAAATASDGRTVLYSAGEGDTVFLSYQGIYDQASDKIAFDRWEITGAEVSDPAAKETSFIMGTSPVQVRYSIKVNENCRKEELPKDADTSTVVKKLSFENKSLKLKAGDVVKNAAAAVAADGTAPAVQYITGNADIVAVSPEGNFMAMGPGKTKVTAYCGTKTAVCNVTVGSYTNDIAILTHNDEDVTGQTLGMKGGEQMLLHVSFFPADTSDPRAVKWTSSNKSVVVKNGMITVKETGSAVEATVTAGVSVTDPSTGKSKTLSKTVTVKGDPVKTEADISAAGHKLVLKKKSLKMVTTKDKNRYDLGIRLMPKKGGNIENCVFEASSTNDRIVSVNKITDSKGSGTVTIEAVRPGTAYVIVTSYDPADKSRVNRRRCKVKVTSPAEEVKITYDSLGLLKTDGNMKTITIREGRYDDLTAVIGPEFSTDAAKGIKWKGGGKVTVKNGLLYAKKATNTGKVTVKCGKKTETINVIVVKKR